MHTDLVIYVASKIAHRAQTASETRRGPDPEKWPAGRPARIWVSGRLGAANLGPGLFVSPKPSECDGIFYMKRRSVDLRALYLNSSVLQTIPNLGTVVCFFGNPEFDNPE